ncbi:uncharacterized protein [Primulina huaijiensis]|uniref:uncharacterized protein n=1 Tax=Primulina huaijiensis TaxID=1492673 RepID=UPI003CC778DA
MAWLINSMTQEISENFLLFQTAKEIWESVQDTFSCKDNTAELFEIEGLLHDLRQGENSVTSYFTNLTRYWQKVDLLESHCWKCQDDGENHRKIVETKRVFKFLFGLDKSLDEVRSRILSTKPLPTIHESVSEVRREESRRKVMLGRTSLNPLESSSLASHEGTYNPTGDQSPWSTGHVASQAQQHKKPRGRPWCEHCRKPGHTKETCWKLHGKPADWKPRGHVAAVAQFNPDQMNILQSIINRVQGSSSSTSPPVNSEPVAQQGNLATALHTEISTSWIVDSGASDHMTGKYSLFTSYTPCKQEIYVSIADGSRSRVIGIGSVRLLPQDMNSGRMIGRAELCGGLYLLKTITPPQAEIKPTSLNLCFNSGPTLSQVDGATSSDDQPQTTSEPSQEIPRGTQTPNCQELSPDEVTESTEEGNIPGNSSDPLSDIELPIALRKHHRTRSSNEQADFLYYGKLSANFRAFLSKIDDVRVPNTVHEALEDPAWRAATFKEFQALEQNGTWDITDLPPGKRTVGCRWLFSVKHQPDRTIERLKARLVAKGYTQSYEIDYQETFAPVAKLNTIRILLSLAVNLEWETRRRSDDEEETHRLKQVLSKEFEIKDLGRLRYFLGMEVGRTKDRIAISQRKYVMDLLKDTGTIGCKASETPMDSTSKLVARGNEPACNKDQYQRLVGKLIYLAHTRPDIGFSVSVVSRFMSNPSEVHMEAVLRILRYLRGNPGKGIMFRKCSNRSVEVYTDADWAGDASDRRSTSGHCSYVWGNIVSWRSKKQSVVERSSAEAELRSLALGICEGMWHQRVLEELRVDNHKSVSIFCDNQ